MQKSGRASRHEIAGDERQQANSDGDKHTANNDARSATPIPAPHRRLTEKVLAANGDETGGKAERQTKLHRNATLSESEQCSRHKRNGNSNDGN